MVRRLAIIVTALAMLDLLNAIAYAILGIWAPNDSVFYMRIGGTTLLLLATLSRSGPSWLLSISALMAIASIRIFSFFLFMSIRLPSAAFPEVWFAAADAAVSVCICFRLLAPKFGGPPLTATQIALRGAVLATVPGWLHAAVVASAECLGVLDGAASSATVSAGGLWAKVEYWTSDRYPDVQINSMIHYGSQDFYCSVVREIPPYAHVLVEGASSKADLSVIQNMDPGTYGFVTQRPSTFFPLLQERRDLDLIPSDVPDDRRPARLLLEPYADVGAFLYSHTYPNTVVIRHLLDEAWSRERQEREAFLVRSVRKAIASMSDGGVLATVWGASHAPAIRAVLQDLGFAKASERYRLVAQWPWIKYFEHVGSERVQSSCNP